MFSFSSVKIKTCLAFWLLYFSCISLLLTLFLTNLEFFYLILIKLNFHISLTIYTIIKEPLLLLWYMSTRPRLLVCTNMTPASSPNFTVMDCKQLRPGIHCATSLWCPWHFNIVTTHTVQEDHMRCKAKAHDSCAHAIRTDRLAEPCLLKLCIWNQHITPASSSFLFNGDCQTSIWGIYAT